MHRRTRSAWFGEMQLASRSWEASEESRPRPRTWRPGPRWAQCRCSGRRGWCSRERFPAGSAWRARPPRCQNTDFSLKACPRSRRSHCSRSWRCCSWSWCRAPGKKSSSAPSRLHCHASGGWWTARLAHTWRTCTLSCSRARSGCRIPRGSPSPCRCTATRPSLTAPASACRDWRHRPAIIKRWNISYLDISDPNRTEILWLRELNQPSSFIQQIHNMCT